MFNCVICRFDAELDDVVAPISGGRCVCLRCYGRETDTALLMSKDLQRDVVSALASLPATWA